MQNESYLRQLRLLLEELCCDLCRFEHVTHDGLPAECIGIDREYDLGMPGAFADIRVVPANLRPYFVEVKYGYPNDLLIRHLRRKYGQDTPVLRDVSRVVLVIDADNRSDWPCLEAELRQAMRSGLELQIWDERWILRRLSECFAVEVQAITAEGLLDVRHAIDRAKGFYAFGGPSLAEYEHDPLKAELMWHFGFWRIHKLLESRQQAIGDLFPPGLYRSVVVLLGDLCSFSSYVRDTPDHEITRECLTAFYSKSRYQIINNGGMFYQFVGDEVIALFGIPERQPDSVLSALDTARALASIGESVSNHWQRQLDRVQASGGLHLGMAIGDLEIVSLRPFSRMYMGAIGDCINVAARLMSVASPGEVVVTNSLYQQIDEERRSSFQEIEPVDAKNVGRIKAWKLKCGTA